jgi:hypothetical protein
MIARAHPRQSWRFRIQVLSIAVFAFALVGCDNCNCFCHKKNDTDWAAVQAAQANGGGAPSGGGTSGGGGGGPPPPPPPPPPGGGGEVPEIDAKSAGMGLMLLAGATLMLVDRRRRCVPA